MGNLLFSPSGRIGPSEFTKGIMILAVISAVLTILPLISMSLAMVGGLVSLVLLFPLFCLLIKRSHDAGKSGWMSIVWFILFAIIMVVLSQVVTMVFGGDVKDAVNAAAESGDLAAVLEVSQSLAKKTAIPSAIAGLVGSFIAAFVINMLNKADDHENQYGPA